MAKRKHPEADEPDDATPEATATIEHPGLLPPLILAPPLLPDGPPPETGAPAPLVGIVHFENAAGLDNGSAHYAVPVTLRDRVLIWRHQRHEQNRINDRGEWVYRLTHDAGVGTIPCDADLQPVEDDVAPANEGDA
jgi:hypothetical protein